MEKNRLIGHLIEAVYLTPTGDLEIKLNNGDLIRVEARGFRDGSATQETYINDKLCEDLSYEHTA